jgi:ubiquinone/menaquinone biosynthesis C-methylase UbiE
MTTPATSPAGAATTMPQMAASFPEMYEKHLVGPLFAPWANRLLDGVDLRPGVALLDVACGTGIVARVASERLRGELRAVGVDRNPAMLGVARATAPAIDWREGDAAALPVKDEQFDIVCCHQGLQFIPDKGAAVRAMRRVLATKRPGASVAIGVWRSLEDNSLFHDLGQVAEQLVGPIADARHSFGDARALRKLLEDAGFREVVVASPELDVTFQDGIALARLNAAAVVGMSSVGKTMSDEERSGATNRILDASLPVLARYTSGKALTFRTAANIATARA